MTRVILAALLVLGLARPAIATPVTLHVVTTAVHDGDTLTFERDGLTDHARLIGIDAPELAQPRWGREAQLLVSELVWRRPTRLVVPHPKRPRDAYGRLLALVYYDDTCIQQVLLSRGLAVANAYGEDVPGFEVFDLLMKNARSRRVGVWSDPGFVDPQVWRKRKKQKDGK
jgi:micrococcal nuclease